MVKVHGCGGLFWFLLLCVAEQSLKHSRRALPSEQAQRLLSPALSLLNPSVLIPAHGAKPRGWRDWLAAPAEDLTSVLSTHAEMYTVHCYSSRIHSAVSSDRCGKQAHTTHTHTCWQNTHPHKTSTPKNLHFKEYNPKLLTCLTIFKLSVGLSQV